MCNTRMPPSTMLHGSLITTYSAFAFRILVRRSEQEAAATTLSQVPPHPMPTAPGAARELVQVRGGKTSCRSCPS
jgi:hypothetical protein